MKFKAAVTGLLVAMPIAGNYYDLYILPYIYISGIYRVFEIDKEFSFIIGYIIFFSSFKDVN